jgi:myo-inositol-1(or 4)-monophosphatase
MDSHLLDLAGVLADAAARVIKPYFRVKLAAEVKADQSPVTRADRVAEQTMRALIARYQPDHGILGEEFGLENADSPWRWVLDPIDGTRAFITGRPLFGTLIGLLHHGEPVLGVLDQPITGERWIGVAGEPTRFRGELGGAIGTRACNRMEDAELSATSPAMMGSELPRFERLAARVRRTSWGGDCYAYGLLALGQIDIVAERDLKPWDWTALVPIVEGAGGKVTDWQGRRLSATSGGDILAVGDPALLGPAVEALRTQPPV